MLPGQQCTWSKSHEGPRRTCVRRESDILSRCLRVQGHLTNEPWKSLAISPFPTVRNVQYSLYKHGVSVHNDWEGAAMTQATLGRRL